jgi:hypothetical protein
MQLWLMLPINGQAAFRVGHGVANRSAAMHVKVRKIDSMGRPLFSGDPSSGAGSLMVGIVLWNLCAPSRGLLPQVVR